MRMCIAGTVLVAMLSFAGTTQAGPIEVQPYFTYSPEAVAFEDIEWSPLDYAAFSAYGGYFANVRQPRFDTPLAQPFFDRAEFGIEDEVSIQANLNFPAFSPAFAAAAFSFDRLALADGGESQRDAAPVPEPGILALVGVGLLAASRTLKRKLAR